MSSRKLQVEIDKVLKKVAEGIESFDDIYDKLHDAPNANHKEKYEQDLKKEIKKLQRHRDQIKTWIASSDIKDKRELLENRRNIEKKMEAFKACEKEMKTKAYSKEGLSQVTKIDPKQKLKMEKRSWITGMVDQLNTQIDMLEAEAEGIASGPKKNKKDSAKVARLKELDHHVERHKWHVQRLELILRAMENGNISPEQVSDIQDDVQFYVESNQEDDFVEDEGVYDELGLDDEEDMFGLNEGYFAGGPALATSGPADEDSSKASAKDKDKDKGKDKDKDKDAGSAKSTSVADTSPALHTTGTTGRSTIKLVNSKQPASPAFASKRSSGASPTTPATTIAAATSTTTAATTAGPSPYGAKTAGTAPGSSTSASGLGQTPTTSSGSGDSTIKTSAASSTGAVSATTAKDALFSPAVASKPETNAWANSNAAAKLAKLASVTSSAATQPYSSVVSSHTSSAVNSLPTSHPVTPIAAAMPSPSASSAKSPGPAGTPQPGSAAQSREPSISVEPHTTPSMPAKSLAAGTAKAASAFAPLSFFRDQELPAAFGNLVYSLEGLAANSGKHDRQYQLQMAETSYQCLPDLADAEKPQRYAPVNPVQTPSYYPQAPLPIFDSPALAGNFGLDTLFYIFYYQQDTYQQYLAAQELQRQSWRFHKRYLTWFQRIEKPKSTTDEYEVGTYVFFDYEDGWCSRQKTDFKFEYQYLEDTELL